MTGKKRNANEFKNQITFFLLTTNFFRDFSEDVNKIGLKMVERMFPPRGLTPHWPVFPAREFCQRSKEKKFRHAQEVTRPR